MGVLRQRGKVRERGRQQRPRCHEADEQRRALTGQLARHDDPHAENVAAKRAPVSTVAGTETRQAMIVLNRRGIARIVPEEGTAAPVAQPEVELPELDEDKAELLTRP